ncbi:hypothetical protein AB0L88_20445 [Saccharopolyspora shandongensis]|uniref:hypothetical protein n=1 Tax=Saccharopolyspora shandongensis TaxID=418495 RepID=UPI0034371E73
MFRLQLSTFVLFNLLILAMLTTRIPLRGLRFAAGQHAGGGERDYTVWRLVADVEAENAEARGAGRRRATDRELREIPTEFPETDPDRPTGRHHLRADRGLLCGDPELRLTGIT